MQATELALPIAGDAAGSLRFVLVGSGRSGTRYAATVFSQLGMPCGHEAVFGWRQEVPANLVGDASFCAVPYLGSSAKPRAVFHQVRHPLAVLRSIIATGFFADPGQFSPHLELIERSLPEIKRRQTPLAKAMYFIVRWNRMCEPFAHLRWRVEALDAPTLSHAAHLAGFSKSLAECDSVLETVDRGINRLELRGLKRLQLTWRDLPDSPEKDDLLELATSYGY